MHYFLGPNSFLMRDLKDFRFALSFLGFKQLEEWFLRYIFMQAKQFHLISFVWLFFSFVVLYFSIIVSFLIIINTSDIVPRRFYSFSQLRHANRLFACKKSALMYATPKLDADSSSKKQKHRNTHTHTGKAHKPIQSAAICHNFERLNVVGQTN